MFGIFASARSFKGKIAYSGMPRHLGYSVNLFVFPVASNDTPAPFGGDPDASQYNDPIFEYARNPQLDSVELTEDIFEIEFDAKTKAAHGYVAISTILFRRNGDKLFAQIERRMYNKRPLKFADSITGLVLPMPWPNIAIDDLNQYGTIKPSGA